MFLSEFSFFLNDFHSFLVLLFRSISSEIGQVNAWRNGKFPSNIYIYIMYFRFGLLDMIGPCICQWCYWHFGSRSVKCCPRVLFPISSHSLVCIVFVYSILLLIFFLLCQRLFRKGPQNPKTNEACVLPFSICTSIEILCVRLLLFFHRTCMPHCIIVTCASVPWVAIHFRFWFTMVSFFFVLFRQKSLLLRRMCVYSDQCWCCLSYSHDDFFFVPPSKNHTDNDITADILLFAHSNIFLPFGSLFPLDFSIVSKHAQAILSASLGITTLLFLCWNCMIQSEIGHCKFCTMGISTMMTTRQHALCNKYRPSTLIIFIFMPVLLVHAGRAIVQIQRDNDKQHEPFSQSTFCWISNAIYQSMPQ